MPLFEAVATLMEQERPGEMRSVLSRVKERLAEGKGLAAALAEGSTAFQRKLHLHGCRRRGQRCSRH